MPINPVRIESDLNTIAGFTHTPGNGASRPTFSPAWRQARDYVIDQARAIGCNVRIDAAGNVHVRPRGVDWTSRVWMSGSHVDSVPQGGDFDGVVGVVGPLEVLRAAHEDGHHDLPLELVIFAEEEGTTFGLGMIGSRAWTGTLSPEELAAVKNEHGENYLDAGISHGVDPSRLDADRLRLSTYHGLIELHIEQGPAMWKRNQAVALVTAAAGRHQYRAEFRGVANHAGSTAMTDRHDALAGAAEAIQGLEALPRTISPQTVATVGHIACHPNAVNVIPDRVSFTIDLRSPDNDALAQVQFKIEALLAESAKRRGLEWSVERTESLPPVAMHDDVCTKLRQATKTLGGDPLPETVSGALHDSAILAPLLPTAMLFVASRDGISHNPAEFSRVEDIALATQILYEMVAHA